MANHFKKSVNSLLLISECYNSRSSASIPAAVNATATRHDRTRPTAPELQPVAQKRGTRPLIFQNP
jgi:hypothetical protein